MRAEYLQSRGSGALGAPRRSMHFEPAVSEREAYQLLFRADAQRAFEPLAANHESSCPPVALLLVRTVGCRSATPALRDSYLLQLCSP